MPELNAFVAISFSTFLSAPIFEEALSAAQDNGIYHEPVLIDEIMLHQRVDKLGATSD